MKTKIFILLLSVLFIGTVAKAQGNNRSDEKSEAVIKIAFTTNLSSAPGKEGAEKMNDFSKGSDKFVITKNSPKDARRVAAKMLAEMCTRQKISYEQYCASVKSIGMKPSKNVSK